MKRKSVFLSIFAIVLFFLPQPLIGESTGPMTIMEDTTLTMNHVGNISIGANGVTLDCNNFTVSSFAPGTGIGISLNNRTNVTVKNCHVHGVNFGFFLIDSGNNTFEENTANGNDRGFFLINSDNNKFQENSADGNDTFDGFSIFAGADKNKFEENSAVDNARNGFRLIGSDKNKFTKNTADNNDENGFNVEGTSELNTFRKNEGSGNTVDASDTSTGVGNKWKKNDFFTCSGLPDPCP